MLRPQVQLHDEYSRPWGLGWHVALTALGEMISHGGDNDGFHPFVVGSVERKSGFVVMTNGENGIEIKGLNTHCERIETIVRGCSKRSND